MIDYKPILVQELSKILPTYYELFVDGSTETPCLTYIEGKNSADEEGTTLRYSTLNYRIKIWGEDLAEMTQYAAQLDNCMFALGFKRMNYNELWFNSKCQMIFDYQAKAKENI